MGCLSPDSLKTFWWQDPESFRVELEEHGSFRAIERSHNVAQGTLSKWSARHGIKSAARSTPKSRVADYQSEVSTEEILREEIRELQVAVQRQRALEVFEERALRILERKLDEKVPVFPAPPRQPSKGKTPHEFALLWSDLHGCEVVRPDQTNGLNAYDFETMKERHWKLRKSILSFKENRPYPVRKLTILPLGDMVSGDIHDELRETNEKVLMEAAVEIGLFGADWIEALAEDFEEIVVDGCVTGNHGRRHKKPQAKNVHDSFDWLVFKVIQLRLAKYERIHVNVQQAAHAFVTVANSRILAFHGDGIRTTMTGVPWGGITRRCKELAEQYEPLVGPIDHFMLGHWHEPHVVKNRRIIVNGSVKGPDEFGIQRGMASPATQLLTTFHPERGLTDVSFIDLQK